MDLNEENKPPNEFSPSGIKILENKIEDSKDAVQTDHIQTIQKKGNFYTVEGLPYNEDLNINNHCIMALSYHDGYLRFSTHPFTYDDGLNRLFSQPIRYDTKPFSQRC